MSREPQHIGMVDAENCAVVDGFNLGVAWNLSDARYDPKDKLILLVLQGVYVDGRQEEHTYLVDPDDFVMFTGACQDILRSRQFTEDESPSGGEPFE